MTGVKRDALLAIAARHNAEIWRESEARIVCSNPACDEACLVPASHAGVCPTCGAATSTTDVGALSWWWWTCCPGCLPDSDLCGPFASLSEALLDATDGLDLDDEE